jgi:ABC-2 type transport system permease protein
MNAFWAVCRREVRGILDRKSYLFLFTVWPLLLALLLGGIYAAGVVTKMPVAVADNDRSMLSRTLVRSVDACRSFRVAYRVETKEELESLMGRDRVVAGIFIPREFERRVKRGETQVVTAFINGSNLMTANLALADLRYAVGTIGAGVTIKYLRKTGSQRERALALQSPVKTDLSKLYNPGYNYLNFLGPGLWLAVFQQVIMLYGALLIAQELDKKTFGDLARTARHRLLPLVAGKIAPYLALSLVLLELLYRGLFPLFRVEIKAPLALVIVFSLLFALAAIALGFLLSALLRNRSDALKGMLVLATPAFLVSGYTWPLQAMPPYLQGIAYILPLTSFLEGFRKLYQQGAGFGYLAKDLLILGVLCVVYLGAGALCVRRLLKEHHRVP